MAWNKIKIQNDFAETVDAIAPEIISASRSTDIPAFYSDWFIERLKVGHSVWQNPFNNVKQYITYKNTLLIVFWSKNPAPMIKHLNFIKSKNIDCYFQYTLNDYENENLEINLPPLATRIETFKHLSSLLGKGNVIWRFDPLILSDSLTVDELINRIVYIGSELVGYTAKLVFSFADIKAYRKVTNNLNKAEQSYREFTHDEKITFATKLSKINASLGWNYELATCCEDIELDSLNIKHNKCIDDELVIKQFQSNRPLMKFLGIDLAALALYDDIIHTKNMKDKGQRIGCGCITSKDIGSYNTCPHGCTYCYANTSYNIANINYQKHKNSPFSEMIVDR